MFPNIEDVAWLLPLLLVTHWLRTMTWLVRDYDVRMVYLELLAGMETTAIGCTLGAGGALVLGSEGVAMYVLSWTMVRLYRTSFWKWDETGNSASLLARVQAGHQWGDLAVVLMYAQFAGGWFGYRYMLWVSSHQKERITCYLPLQAPLLQGAMVEMLGTLLLEVVSQGLRCTFPCQLTLHRWASFFTKLSVFCVAKLTGATFTGAVYNPMAALIRFHKCILNKDYVGKFLLIYIIGPFLGAVMSVKLVPTVQHIADDLHRYFGGEENTGRVRLFERPATG